MTRTTPKLALRTETLRSLSHDELRDAVGGFLMRDTVIVPTSGRIAPVGPPDGGQGPR